jgi:UDP-2,4-diacetamido-2,4,6-trideoxy-beta-L-altropyranose hydrolase
LRFRIVFRVDANKIIGRGHLSRLLSIAEMLRAEFEIIFICNNTSESFCSEFFERFKFVFIENDCNLSDILTKHDLLFIDGYQFDDTWRITYQNLVKGLAFINDLPEEVNGTNIVLNHTPGIKRVDFAAIKNDMKFYLGLNYAMIRPAFLEIARQPQIENKGAGVFICFGGADPLNLLQSFVDNLLKKKFTDPIYSVGKLSGDYSKYPNLNNFDKLDMDDMIRYMLMSKVLLVPSSILSFEGIALRKPIFSVFYVMNQKLNYQGMIEMKLCAGGGGIFDSKDVPKIVDEFLGFYVNTNLHKEIIYQQFINLDGNSDKRMLGLVNDFFKVL